MSEQQPDFTIIPAVDVLGGKVVRLLRGSYDEVTEYSADPVAAAERWMSQGAGLVHIVDLDGARTGEPDSTLWHRLAAVGVPFQVGGGIRDEAIAAEALSAGAERVVMGSAAISNPEILARLAAEFGPDRVGAALDVSEGRARGGGWLGPGKELDQVLESLQGPGWIFVTSIVRDGTLEGPDLELFHLVSERVSRFRLGVAGGVGKLDDLAAVIEAGAAAVIVGRALYEGAFTLAEAIAATQTH